MQDQPPPPSLGQLQRQICWWWVICEKCLHGVPVALVPLIIRCGANASSDRLRRSVLFGWPKRPYCDECIQGQFPTASLEYVEQETKKLRNQTGFLPVNDICTRCNVGKANMTMAIC
jgi:hypothetical protein